MRTTNRVHLIGYLGADPEGFLTKANVQGARFRIATTESWRDDNGEQKSLTDWHRVVVFGIEAQSSLQHLSKGRLVQVEGRLKTRTYLDKENQKRSETSVVADRVSFLDAPKATVAGAGE
jgi:single-strand DNA-binding protein